MNKEGCQESEERYRRIFHTARVSLWIQDFSELIRALNKLRESGIEDF